MKPGHKAGFFNRRITQWVYKSNAALTFFTAEEILDKNHSIHFL